MISLQKHFPPLRKQWTGVLSLGAPGSYDSKNIWPAGIVVNPLNANQLVMIYGSQNDNYGLTVGRATASVSDPAIWTKNGSAVLTGVLAGGSIVVGSEIWFYCTGVGGSSSINLYISSDGGNTFTLFGTVISGGDAYSYPYPMRGSDNKIYLYCTKTVGGAGQSIKVLSSADGKTSWTDHGVIFTLGVLGTFDDIYIEQCTAYLTDNGVIVSYGGYDGSNWAIGIATSATPAGTYTKYGRNPVYQKTGRAGSFEKEHVVTPLLIDVGNTSYMYYQGGENPAYEVSNWKVGLAYCPERNTLKIPLWDGWDTETVAGQRIFNGVAEEIGGSAGVVSNDEFGASTQQDMMPGGDGAKLYGWNLLNSVNASAVNVDITNAGYLTISLNTTSSYWWGNIQSSPFIYKSISDFASATMSFTDNSDATTEGTLLMVRSETGINWVAIRRMLYNGTITIINTVNGTTYYTDISSSDSFFRITRAGNVYKLYSKAAEGNSWTLRGSFTRADFSSTLQVGVSVQNVNTAGNFIAKVDYFRINNEDASPNPEWEAIASGSKIYPQTIRIPENMNAGDTGTLTYKYAVNNGVYSSFISQEDFKFEADITVTDAVNSLSIVPKFVGAQASCRAFAEIDVTLSAGGGGGGGYLIDGGLCR